MLLLFVLNLRKAFLITKKRQITGVSDTSEPKRGKNQLPSRDEQLVLNQTSILARENLINLQVNGMLEEVSCDNFYSNKKIQNYVDTIREILQNASSKKYLSKWGDLLHVSNTKQLFPAPSKTHLVGSYDLLIATSPYLNVDICCTIPDDYFEKK